MRSDETILSMIAGWLLARHMLSRGKRAKAKGFRTPHEFGQVCAAR